MLFCFCLVGQDLQVEVHVFKKVGQSYYLKKKTCVQKIVHESRKPTIYVIL